MSRSDSARCFYTAARDEILRRIQLRDNIAIVYLVAVGTFTGVAFSHVGGTRALLPIPLLALGTSLLSAQHFLVIGGLALFCASEVQHTLEEEGEDAPQWDNSRALAESHTKLVTLRTLGQMIIMLAPCILSLAISYTPETPGWSTLRPLWWLGVAASVATLAVTIFTLSSRIRTRNKLSL